MSLPSPNLRTNHHLILHLISRCRRGRRLQRPLPLLPLHKPYQPLQILYRVSQRQLTLTNHQVRTQKTMRQLLVHSALALDVGLAEFLHQND